MVVLVVVVVGDDGCCGCDGGCCGCCGCDGGCCGCDGGCCVCDGGGYLLRLLCISSCIIILYKSLSAVVVAMLVIAA